MARPYSDDLRERVVRAVEGGSSRHEAAGQFAVSVSFVVKLMQRFHATGSFKPSDFGGHGKPKLAEHEAVVRELIEQTPSATLLELRRALLERGIEVGKSSIGRFLKRLRISYKKKRFARPSRSVRTSPPRAPPGVRSSRPSTLGSLSSSTKPGRPRP
jgi:putative transposase